MKILPINTTVINHAQVSRITGSMNNAITNAANKAGKVGGPIILASIVLATIPNVKPKAEDSFEIKELSQEEFEQKCEGIENAQEEAHEEWLKMKENYDKNAVKYGEYDFPTFAFISYNNLNQWNVQLLDYMLKHPETYKYNYNDLANDIASMRESNHKQKSAEVILKMLKMPFLFPKEYDTNKHFGLDRYMYEEKNADTKIKILDMIEENKTDYDRAQRLNLRNILTWIETEDGLRVAKKLIEKPDILKAWIHENAFRYFSNEKDKADIKIAFADKINSNPKLLEDAHFIKFVGDNFCNVTDKETLKFACKLWDNPILFESESFRKWAKSMIYEYPKYDHKTDKATREVMNKIVDAVAQRPELFKNQKFKDDFGELLFVRKGPQNEIYIGGNRPIEEGNRNLFLIENGYYDQKEAKQ